MANRRRIGRVNPVVKADLSRQRKILRSGLGLALCLFVLGALSFPALAAPGSAASKSIPNIVAASSARNVIGDQIFAVADQEDRNEGGLIIGNRKLTLLGVDFRGRPLAGFGPNGRSRQILIGRKEESWLFQPPKTMAGGRVVVGGRLEGDLVPPGIPLYWMRSGWMIAVYRRGKLDRSFGKRGLLVRRYYQKNPLHTQIFDLETGGGNIYTCGLIHTQNMDPEGMFIRAVDKHGRPLASFGQSGQVTVAPAPGHFYKNCRDMTVLSDGRLLIAGVDGMTGYGGSPQIFLARYMPNGQPDPSFGVGGERRIQLPPEASPYGSPTKVLVSDDGVLTIAAHYYYLEQGKYIGRESIGRYSSAGDLDTSYGNAGFADPPPFLEYAFAFDRLRRLLVGGGDLVGREVKPGISRLTADGHFDQTFGTNGSVIYKQKHGAFVSLFPRGDRLWAWSWHKPYRYADFRKLTRVAVIDNE